MAFEDLLEVGTMIRFAVLFVPLAIYIIFFSDNTIKWKFLLTLGSFLGVAIALAGKTIGKSHGFGGSQ